MQNKLELETVSVELYKYLCEEVVGSKNVVRYRRLYFKLHDDMADDNRWEIISSGSKAEGLDLPGSDFDMMLLLKPWGVYEDKPKDIEDVLMLDTKNALPGFGLLKKLDGSSFPWPSTLTAYGSLISNSEMHKFIFSEKGQVFSSFLEINGPSMTSSFLIDTDMLHCLKCQTWPTIAKQWLLRFRPSGWPSHEIISKIVSQGCLLVPVGSKSSCSEGNPFEWRFSFSLSEKLLVHSLNHTQLLCYVLLKIWLKEKLNSDKILNNKLCSYYMKTVLFWILEEDENLKWIPRNLLHCFLLCIDRLHYWTVCGYFPNYFIPEHNMIDGKLSHEDLAYLSLTLDKMNMRENWKLMFSVPSLHNFRNVSINDQRKPRRLHEFDKTVLSLQTFGSLVMDTSNQWQGNSVSACIIYRLIHKHLPNSARKILILMFLRENMNKLASFTIVYCSNKRGYHGYKGCLSCILINTFHDAEFGWLFLAAFFYSTEKYYEMACILELSSSIFSLKNCFVEDELNIQSFRDISKLKKMVYSRSFMKRMRYEISRVVHLEFNGHKTESYPFLSEEIPKIAIVEGLKSHCLFFFLKFLLGRKQGNSLETESALTLLKTTVEAESNRLTNMFCLMSYQTLLIQAFLLLQEDGVHQKCSPRSFDTLIKSDTFKALVDMAMKLKKWN